MSNSVFIKNLYTKCRIHGAGEAQVAISDNAIYALIVLAVHDLNWSLDELGLNKSPTSHLDLVSQLPQSIGNFFAVFALNFDHPILDRATAAAGLLELKKN